MVLLGIYIYIFFLYEDWNLYPLCVCFVCVCGEATGAVTRGDDGGHLQTILTLCVRDLTVAQLTYSMLLLFIV